MHVLTQIDVVLQRVFDWSKDATLRDLLRSNAGYSYTQHLGAAAFRAGAQAVLVPSATGIDANLIVFVENVGEGTHVDVIKQIINLRPSVITLEEARD